MAAILPPAADEDPGLAERVNVHGTRALLAAAAREPLPPRLVFSSSFAVFGPTRDLAPPRRADDPTVATDPYSGHKIQAEEAIRGSALDWTILRFCDVPPREPRRPHPLLFQIPLDTRFETLHPADAATAIVAALHCDAASRRVLLVGGGARCQMLYRDYLFGFLDALGVGSLPEDAFATEPHYGDWLDSAESERLLHYQRHGFDDIVRDVVAGIGDDVVDLLRMVGPLAQEYLLSMSPYVRRRPSSSRSG
jgi:nucleoside-diphosphate-sugar epimerase